MDSAWVFIREICLAIWFGGLIAIDLIETPVRITTPDISKERLTAIGGRVFTRFGWIQVGLGAISLAASFFICNTLKIAGCLDSFPVISIVVMLVISLIQSVGIAPQMHNLRILFYARNAGYDVRRKFWIVHSIYLFGDLIKMIIGFWLLYHLSRAHHQITL
jgi:uncharacterized membrane protein